MQPRGPRIPVPVRNLRLAQPGAAPKAPIPGAEESVLEFARVLGIGSAALKRALATLGETEVDFEAVKAAFDATQVAVLAQEDVFLMEERRPLGAEGEGGHGIDALDLEAALGTIAQGRGVPQFELEEAVGEEAGISIQMLVQSPNETLQRSAEQRLQNLRRRDLDRAAAAREGAPAGEIAAVLIEAVVDFAESLPIRVFDSVFTYLAPTFRRVVSPLLEHLAPISDRLSEKGREALWPHAVDEMLLFLRRRRVGLDPRLEAISPEARERGLLRLVQLPAIKASRIDPASFEMEQTFVYGLMLELLQMPGSRPVIGPIVFGALRRSLPQETWLANVFRSASVHSPDLDSFSMWAIISRAGIAIDPRCVDQAANQLVVRLEGLPAESREGSWIPGALVWLGEHGTLRALDFLERVRDERKFLRHTWSKACRDAARIGIDRGWNE